MSAKYSLRNTKKVVFFFFFFLLDKAIVFDPSHAKNVICNRFFNLIHGIQINKMLFVYAVLKIAFIKLLQYSYLHLLRMRTNYLHRILIFLLPKVYSIQVFIQHIVTIPMQQIYIRETFYLIKLNKIFHYTRRITPMRPMICRGLSPRHCACGQYSSFRRYSMLQRW